MKSLKTWVAVLIVAAQLTIMGFGYFINRTLEKIDARSLDHEDRLRTLEQVQPYRADTTKTNDIKSQ